MTLPLFICLVGLALWFLCSQVAKLEWGWLSDVGKWSFVVALLVYLWSVSGKSL